MIDSTKYTGMELDWNNDRTWKWVFEPKEENKNSSSESEDCAEEPNTKITSNKRMGCLISLTEDDYLSPTFK